jgi:hypothetical protein
VPSRKLLKRLGMICLKVGQLGQIGLHPRGRDKLSRGAGTAFFLPGGSIQWKPRLQTFILGRRRKLLLKFPGWAKICRLPEDI